MSDLSLQKLESGGFKGFIYRVFLLLLYDNVYCMSFQWVKPSGKDPKGGARLGYRLILLGPLPMGMLPPAALYLPGEASRALHE